MTSDPVANLPEPDPERIYEAIKDGVQEAFSYGLDSGKICDAIQEGVKEAFDQLWVSQIQDAISWGVKEAFKSA